MKPHVWFGAGVFSICVAVQAQLATPQLSAPANSAGAVSAPDAGAYQVRERGPHHRVWERVTYEQGPFGPPVAKVHRYTELATGLHYWDGAQWVESSEVIEGCPSGAQAIHGQHKAFFGNNLATDPVVIVMPDGGCLTNHIAGLSYYDRASGQSVLFAEVQDCQGTIQAPNRVLYENAFSGCRANVRYTYSRRGVEQDVILLEQPPAPDVFGLSAQTTIIEVVTEFINPPSPRVSTAQFRVGADGAVADQNLSFPKMRFGLGRAFSTEEPDSAGRVRVSKEWLQMEGRQFLLEQVPLPKLRRQLQTLPSAEGAAIQRANKVISHTASLRRSFPHFQAAQRKSGPMEVAAVALPANGLVLDYTAVNAGISNYVFKGDTTYLVSGGFDAAGTTTLEGGAVIKYSSNTNLSPCLFLHGPLNCQTGPYRPAVLTSSDDNSIGEVLSGGSGHPVSGNPVGFEAMGGLTAGTNWQFSNVRVCYALAGFVAYDGSDVLVRDCQFVNCSYGAGLFYDQTRGTVTLQNCLFANCGVPVLSDYRANAVNVTADNFSSFCYTDDGVDDLTLTNCLLSRSGDWYVSDTGNTNLPIPILDHTATVPAPAGVFQTVGAANYYLAGGSTNRDAGTTNIDPVVLAELKQKTTFPPIVYSNVTFSIDAVFPPQAQRDTDLLDLGYHYDPMDYAFGGIEADANLTFSAGTAVGYFSTSPGGYHSGQSVHLGDTKAMNFQGTISSPDYWVVYCTVQEGPNGVWGNGYGAAGSITGWAASNANAPLVNMRFTKCSQQSYGSCFVRDDSGQILTHAQDCEFYAGGFGGWVITVALTNCLLERTSINVIGGVSPNQVTLKNCTMHGSTLGIDRWPESWGSPGTGLVPVTIVNSAFDGTSITTSDAQSGNSSLTYMDYNAFLQGASQTYPTGSYIQTVTNFNWQTSWLGNFYLPSDSLLIDTGNTTADLVGLYHYTTQTNDVGYPQTPEGISQVDIGYHYVALDANGNALDYDSDGVPDYLEDVNGNGVVDSGETDWQNAYDTGLKVFITRPQSGANLP